MKKSKLKSGQALVALLVFAMIATIIISSAVAISIINSQATSDYAIGEEAYGIAEAGADNAILRILRDPQENYIGETLPMGNGETTIEITRTPPNIIISSVGEVNGFYRIIEVEGTFVDNIFTATRYEEID